MQAIHEHIAKDGFRLRGIAMSRIDGFSDVVFGFALTLIVASLEVPKTYDEMHEVIIGFFPFSICFVFLIMVWWAHFRFFRRYGLHDAGTIVINAVLLFTTLIYTYLLKFLWTLIGMQITGHTGHATDVAHKAVEIFSAPWQVREMMTMYGAGFAATYFCLAALYWNAWRQRRHLHLNPLEEVLTLAYFWDMFGVACVGLVCILCAYLLPVRHAGNAGFCFFLIGVYKTVHGSISGKRIRLAHARTPVHERLGAASRH